MNVAFPFGDSTDGTLQVLHAKIDRLQKESNPAQSRTAKIILKDFGANFDQSVENRHSFYAQGTRRKGIGRSRKYLLYAALKPEHE